MRSNRLLNRPRNLHGSGALAAVQLPGGHSQLCQHGAIRWLKAKRLILGLAGALLATACLSPSLHAGVIFGLDPGSGPGGAGIYPGGTLSVGIVVSSDLTGNSVNWGNAGFNLTWNPSVLVLQATPVTIGSPLPLTLANFNSSSGELDFSWFSAGFGTPVPDGSTLFTVNFTAVGDLLSSTAVSFGNVATIGLEDSTGHNRTSTSPGWNDGTVTVIPEPINWALGLFASVFVVAIVARTRRVRDRIRRWRAAFVRWADAV